MMKRYIKGLELAGIIIVYVAATSIFLAMILSWASWGWLETYETILLIISLVAIIITILYHTGSIKSKVLVGITGILVSVIGGILILVSKDDYEKHTPQTLFDKNNTNNNHLNDWHTSLKLVHGLFVDGLIDEITYLQKKQNILKALNSGKSLQKLAQFPNSLKIIHLIISIFWFGIALLAVFQFYTTILDIVLFAYIIITSIFTYLKINENKKVIKVISYINFFIMIFFFAVIAPGYGFSGLIPIIMVFAFFQFFISLFTIIYLSKKQSLSEPRHFNSEVLIQKAKILYEEKVLLKEELQEIIRVNL